MLSVIHKFTHSHNIFRDYFGHNKYIIWLLYYYGDFFNRQRCVNLWICEFQSYTPTLPLGVLCSAPPLPSPIILHFLNFFCEKIWKRQFVHRIFASDFKKRHESSSFALRSHRVRDRNITTERNLNDESRTNHPHRNPSGKTQRRRLLLPGVQRSTNSPTMPEKVEGHPRPQSRTWEIYSPIR